YIFLTQSLGFFGTVDLSTLSNSFLHGAHITVSDGERTFILREYEETQNNYSIYFYSVDTDDNNALNFRGTVGKTYTLTIEYDGKTYSSEAYIPPLKPLDYLWAMHAPEGSFPDRIKNAMTLYARYSDPDTAGNRSRYFIKQNNSRFSPPLYSVDEDVIVNGTTVDIQLLPGVDKMDSTSIGQFRYFETGDTVVVKWTAIDKGVFDFWRTLEFSYGATGNPFASPVEITTNIKGGALGVWAGYNPSYDTLILEP